MRLARRIGVAIAAIGGVYAILIGGFYWAMCQPPERFGAIMARVPMPAIMILPFRPLWNSARGGHLAVGDAAPDFTLPTADHSRTVTLSQEWRERPVVLVFGSYT